MSIKLLYTVSGTRLILTVYIQNLKELQLYDLLLKHVNQTDGLTEGVDGPFLYLFILIFIAQKVSNIHLVTKDLKIFPLTNLLKLFLAGRVI